MKIFCFIALFAAVMFSGCVSVDYVGQKLPAYDRAYGQARSA